MPAAVHPTTTKDSKVISLDMLADICAAVSIPVVAIGGMTAENCQPSIQAGCAGDSCCLGYLWCAGCRGSSCSYKEEGGRSFGSMNAVKLQDGPSLYTPMT